MHSAPSATHIVHEKRDALPVAWTKHSRAQKDVIVPVRVGLKQRNLEHSDRFLEDISDPDSPNFGKLAPTAIAYGPLTINPGKHWTAERVANTFAPHPEASETTLDWLHASGINKKRIKHSVGGLNTCLKETGFTNIHRS